jgi:beta-phosphoglucomutase-like phosphatase (HAD superfamily)
VPPAAVAFDFNGTISLDQSLLHEIWAALFAEVGKPFAYEDYAALAGCSSQAIVDAWLGPGYPDAARLVARRLDGFREAAVDGRTVTQNVRDAVLVAAARGPVAVVSGALRSEVELVLAGAGLTDAVDVVVAREDTAHEKPDPAPYSLALERLGAPPAEAVLAIEDTETGIAAAKAAGLRCVGVLGTQHPDLLAAADEIVSALDGATMRRLLAL